MVEGKRGGPEGRGRDWVGWTSRSPEMFESLFKDSYMQSKQTHIPNCYCFATTLGAGFSINISTVKVRQVKCALLLLASSGPYGPFLAIQTVLIRWGHCEMSVGKCPSSNVSRQMSVSKCLSANVRRQMSVGKCPSANVCRQMFVGKCSSVNVRRQMSPMQACLIFFEFFC